MVLLQLIPTFFELWLHALLWAFTTARTIDFEIEIHHGLIDPVGNGPRSGILVNGTFPGPALRAQAGDNINFIVRNRLRQDTAVHFHGIKHSHSPWSDGTPGISQPPISPGSSYLYRWRAEESGVYFYHGHSRGQIMDGLYGTIVIAPREEYDRPFHLISALYADQKAMRAAEASIQPLLVADYTQLPFEEFEKVQMESNVEILCMDAIIVHGQGSEFCLPRKTLDAVTDQSVWDLLELVGVPGGLTNKGCLPPLQIVQGDFDMNLTSLPDVAFDECIGGARGNYTINVNSATGWTALAFVNAGAQHPLLISIDSHDLHVFDIDSQYVHPTLVDQIVVGNGNRVSVLVKLNQVVGRYTIRITHQLANQVVSGFAELVYDHSTEPGPGSKPKVDLAGKPLPGVQNFREFAETDSKPYPPKKPARLADHTHKMLMKKLGGPLHRTGEWTLSGRSAFSMAEENRTMPLLFDLPPEGDNDLILMTQTGEWVDLIVETEGPIARYHPMHKHGSKFFVLGSGLGRFPWDTVAEAERALPKGTFNFENPAYLDTVQTKRSMTGAWLVLRYRVESPGAWLFHCHIQPHLTGGMGVVILDGVDQYPEVPEAYREWNGFERPSAGDF